MARKNNSGNGNGVAPAEVVPDSGTAATPPDDGTATGEQQPDGIPPDPQMTTEELKRLWVEYDSEASAHEARAAFFRGSRVPIEQELCRRIQDAAKAAGQEAVVLLGDRRMKVKARPEKHGGGLHLVEAKVNAPLDI